MKQEHKPMTLIVKNFDCNKRVIEDYDVLRYRKDLIKKLKKECATKEEFSEKLSREFKRQYWSRAEYELIIMLTDDNRVLLRPWVGCLNDSMTTIDVTNDTTFDWRGFAQEHIGKQIYNEAKIDIWDQICYADRFDALVTMLWTTRLPYERDDPKFHE